MRLFLAAPLVALSVLRAPPPTPFVFATLDRPVGVAVTASAVFATQECSFHITAIAPHGTSFLFATLPRRGQQCTERYIAVPTARFGGDLFATQGRTAFRVSRGAVTRLVKLPPSVPPNGMGITFDRVGTWGGDMILTTHDGQVWRVSTSGSATFVADVGSQAEGPAVAPRSFSAAPGDILVPNKFANEVFAVEPDGTVMPLASWDSPEKVDPVPSQPCTVGPGGPAYLVALRGDDQLVGFPSSNFAGLGGAMVTSELKTTIANMKNDGTISPWSGPLGTQGDEALEGSDFCRG